MKWLKSKWLWIILVLVVLAGGWYWRSRSAAQGPFFDTRSVERGTVIQTVDVTGEIKPDARIDLGFKGSGRLENIHVTIGQAVKKGDVLADIEARDASFNERRAAATYAIAAGSLNARLAGETDEAIAIAEAGVAQAEASLQKARVDLEITKRTVEDEYRLKQIALEKARLDLLNEGTSSKEDIQNAYDNLVQDLQTSLNSMQVSLTDADAIIGVDNTAANDGYESVLSIYDHTALARARVNYPTAKSARVAADTSVRALGASPSREQVKASAALVKYALERIELVLDDTQKALAGTIANAYLSETELASKKATIGTDRTAITTRLAAVTAGIQAVSAAELGDATTAASLQSAYDTAVANLQIADQNRTSDVQTATTNLAIQEAALRSAQATLNLKLAPPREVDIAALRGQVAEAQVAWEQARAQLDDVRIVAPTDGIITDIVLDVGEQASPNQTVLNMIGTSGYTIEALVPEADIAKVAPGQPAEVTLDAYGDDVRFTGTVLAENPDQTTVQDAIYYKTYIQIDVVDRDVKPGMTANVIITTGLREQVLVVPTRGLRERDGKRYVRVLDGTEPREAEVTVGLRGDEGRTEAISGVKEGEWVIIGELTAAEYQKQRAAEAK